MNLPVHDTSTAPEHARPLLESAQQKFGFLPNLLGALANAPAALEGYLTLSGIYDKASLSPAERQVVLLAVSYENACGYCMAAHTAIASSQGVDRAVIDALRDGEPIPDDRLEALRRFAADVARTRGWPSNEAAERFAAAGYTPAQALEVVLGVTVKTLSNYANHLADTPLDGAFTQAAWTAPAAPGKA